VVKQGSSSLLLAQRPSRRTTARGIRNVNVAVIRAGAGAGGGAILQLRDDDLSYRGNLSVKVKDAVGSQEQIAIGMNAAPKLNGGPAK